MCYNYAFPTMTSLKNTNIQIFKYNFNLKSNYACD